MDEKVAEIMNRHYICVKVDREERPDVDQVYMTAVQLITGGGGMQEYFKMMPENQNIWIESALYSPAMVRDAVDMAVAILKGETVEPVKIIPTTIVDRDNYTQFIDPNSPY